MANIIFTFSFRAKSIALQKMEQVCSPTTTITTSHITRVNEVVWWGGMKGNGSWGNKSSSTLTNPLDRVWYDHIIKLIAWKAEKGKWNARKWKVVRKRRNHREYFWGTTAMQILVSNEIKRDDRKQSVD